VVARAHKVYRRIGEGGDVGGGYGRRSGGCPETVWGCQWRLLRGRAVLALWQQDEINQGWNENMEQNIKKRIVNECEAAS
jgi:hypothetical protein